MEIVVWQLQLCIVKQKHFAMLRFLLILFFAPIVSCNSSDSSGVYVTIVNQRDTPLSRIILTNGIAANEIVVTKLHVGEKYSGCLSFRDVPKTDGAYHVQVEGGAYPDNTTSFYYTNGSALEKEVKLIVQNDSTIVDVIRKDLY